MDSSLLEKIAKQIEQQSDRDITRGSIDVAGTEVTVTHYDKGEFHISFACEPGVLHAVAEHLPSLEKKLKEALPYQIRLDRPRRKTVAKIPEPDHR